MSGPVTDAGADVVAATAAPQASIVEITESRPGHVGSFTMRRALPRRDRRTVGP